MSKDLKDSFLICDSKVYKETAIYSFQYLSLPTSDVLGDRESSFYSTCPNSTVRLLTYVK